jgi:hypothetical protein
MAEVLAHLTSGASLNPGRWLAGVIRCRFDFDKQATVPRPCGSAARPRDPAHERRMA